VIVTTDGNRSRWTCTGVGAYPPSTDRQEHLKKFLWEVFLRVSPFSRSSSDMESKAFPGRDFPWDFLFHDSYSHC
jgi:hypothetical protein